MSQIKKGTILIAIDVCKMHGTKQETLIIGKEYEVIKKNNDEFYIIDEEECNHYFGLDEYKEFFTIKT